MDTPTRRIGIYAGTFDPFTIGHADIVQRALGIVDELHILLAVNPAKREHTPLTQRLSYLQALYASTPAIRVTTHSGLIATYARSVGASLLVRGVRNITDVEYERQMADVHLTHFGIDTLFLFATPQLSHISSSMVRELSELGEDITPYLPLLP